MFAYQGGKTKVANRIYNVITERHGKDITFVDVCCGGVEFKSVESLLKYVKNNFDLEDGEFE